MSFFEITGTDYLELLRKRLVGDLPELTWLQQCRALCGPHLPGDPLILDIGCATGYTYNAFKQNDPRYIGVDVEPKFLQLAREHFSSSPKVQFHEHDINTAPLPARIMPERADLVICSAIIEHFPSLLPSLANIAATVGGQLFLRTFLGETDEIHSVASPVPEFAATHRKYSNRYSFRSVLGWLGTNGFRVKTVRDQYTESAPYWIDGAVRSFYIVLAERIAPAAP